jgi:urease accessory protein
MHSTPLRRTILALLGMATSATSSLAIAHIGGDGTAHSHADGALQSLMAGALHPLTGVDHLAAMVSVGLWSALSMSGHNLPHSPPVSRLLAAPAAFAATLLGGALLGMGGLTLPGIEPMIAASLLVLGLLVATRLHLGTAAGAALAALFALFHGMAHGAELEGHAIALVGMVLSTAALHTAGLWAGLNLRHAPQRPQRWATRIAGAGVALMGLGIF